LIATLGEDEGSESLKSSSGNTIGGKGAADNYQYKQKKERKKERKEISIPVNMRNRDTEKCIRYRVIVVK